MNPNELFTHYVQNLSDLESLDLEPQPLPSGEWGVTVIGENVDFAVKMLYLSDDKRIAIGVERLGPSRLIGTHIGETLYFLAGRITCRPAEGGALRAESRGLLLLPARRRRRVGRRGDLRQAVHHPFRRAAADVSGRAR